MRSSPEPTASAFGLSPLFFDFLESQLTLWPFGLFHYLSQTLFFSGVHTALLLSQAGTAWSMHSISPLHKLAHLLYYLLNFDLPWIYQGHLPCLWISLSHHSIIEWTLPWKPWNLQYLPWCSKSSERPSGQIFDSIEAMFVPIQVKYNKRSKFISEAITVRVLHHFISTEQSLVLVAQCPRTTPWPCIWSGALWPWERNLWPQHYPNVHPWTNPWPWSHPPTHPHSPSLSHHHPISHFYHQ